MKYICDKIVNTLNKEYGLNLLTVDSASMSDRIYTILAEQGSCYRRMLAAESVIKSMECGINN